MQSLCWCAEQPHLLAFKLAPDASDAAGVRLFRAMQSQLLVQHQAMQLQQSQLDELIVGASTGAQSE